MSSARHVVANVGVAAVGAAAAAGAFALAGRSKKVAKRWDRVNHRGETVTLLEGPAFAAGAMSATSLAPGLNPATRLAGLLATAAGAALGGYDDLSGSADRRGLRGHLTALRSGEVTTGAVKIFGLGAAGLLCGVLVRERVVDAVLAAGVIASSANFVNLLDLRPARAIKAGLLAGVPLFVAPGRTGRLAAGAVGAASALLPTDLGERAMLGDTGANALGAAVGLAYTAEASRLRMLAMLAGLAALTLASERVSFSKVIASTPGLRELDALGRRDPVPVTSDAR